ncbi:hypothetical protein ACIRPQ_05870 [Streptomyces sp. NPDC101213]|uniref:hypothetical protein n=1 Tax=Streptomyces sp. NPDC101213 TaxID=3366130 RepID=UPI0037FB5F6C
MVVLELSASPAVALALAVPATAVRRAGVEPLPGRGGPLAPAAAGEAVTGGSGELRRGAREALVRATVIPFPFPFPIAKRMTGFRRPAPRMANSCRTAPH